MGIIKYFEENVYLSWAITFIGACLIFYISSLQFSSSGYVSPGILAILYHLLAFLCFGLFFFISFVNGKHDWRLFVLSFLFIFAYAISDEIHQFFVPGRSCSLFDIFIDLVGISFAMMIYLVVILRSE